MTFYGTSITRIMCSHTSRAEPPGQSGWSGHGLTTSSAKLTHAQNVYLTSISQILLPSLLRRLQLDNCTLAAQTGMVRASRCYPWYMEIVGVPKILRARVAWPDNQKCASSPVNDWHWTWDTWKMIWTSSCYCHSFLWLHKMVSLVHRSRNPRPYECACVCVKLANFKINTTPD